jgi:hypothetical protein
MSLVMAEIMATLALSLPEERHLIVIVGLIGGATGSILCNA